MHPIQKDGMVSDTFTCPGRQEDLHTSHSDEASFEDQRSLWEEEHERGEHSDGQSQSDTKRNSKPVEHVIVLSTGTQQEAELDVDADDDRTQKGWAESLRDG